MLPNEFVAPERVAVLASLLGAAAVKATVVLMVGTVAVLFARHASAATRHLLWVLTLGGALVVPVAAEVLPKWRVPIASWSVAEVEDFTGTAPVRDAATGASSNAVFALSPRAASSTRATPDRVRHPAGGRNEPASGSAGIARSSASGSSSPAIATTVSGSEGSADVVARSVAVDSLWTTIAPWVGLVWALGVAVALMPTLVGMIRLALLERHARPMRGGRWALLVPSALREIDVRRRVRFVELDGAMPMTWGIVRPVVLVPSGDFDSTIAQRLDVLRHELAHVRRHDCLTQLVAQVACAVHWFNPLAWVAARQLRIERERACDDEVLRAGAKASEYADYLLRVARTMHTPGAAAFGGLAMARPSQLAGRLLAVLDERRERVRMSFRIVTRAAFCAVPVVFAIASVTPTPATARQVQAAALGKLTPLAPMTPLATSVGVGAAASTQIAHDVVGPTPVGALTAPGVSWLSGAVSAPTATTLAPVATVSLPPMLQGAPCDRAGSSGKSSHTNMTSSDNGSKRWRVLWSVGDCSFELDARGDIKFNRDVTDIESISSGGSFTLEQHIGDDTKRLVVRSSGGGLERSYYVNGGKRDFDSEGRAWLAEALVALDRQTAFAVDQRVPSILERSGVTGVLQEISLLGSDYARRRYYTKLLASRQLDRAQVRRVVEQAGSEMSSDYELAELLVALSKLDAFSDDSHTAFVSAAKKVDSDYERRRALNALLQRDRLAPATVEALLDAASTINSDYELAELLISVSKKYAIDDNTRPVYLKAVGTIQSDYEHRRVLSTIVAGGGLTPQVTRAIIEDASRIGSDYELAEFLIQIATKNGLDATTRDAYFAAANKIKSDYEHHRALTPLLKRDLLTKEIAKGILASATNIESDYECATLLVEVANAITIDDDLRPSFEKAADTIQSEYDYGRVMGAVRRRVTR